MTPWTACQSSLTLHYLPEFAQTHVHWVGDAIQSSYPLSRSSPSVLKVWLSLYSSFQNNQFPSIFRRNQLVFALFSYYYDFLDLKVFDMFSFVAIFMLLMFKLSPLWSAGMSSSEFWLIFDPFLLIFDHSLLSGQIFQMHLVHALPIHAISHFSKTSCCLFIGLDKAVVHMNSLISFLWLWFSFSPPSDNKDKKLMEASWWERLTVG